MTRNVTLSLSLLCLLTSAAQAQVTASSYSEGGTAISTASGRGNTQLNASSYAAGGGYARATMTGRGTNGGFASGNSTASSYGGVAISNGRSVANGWGARSDAQSHANAYRGYARSDGTAIANGRFAQAGADAEANAFYNFSRSQARAVDNRGFTQSTYPTGTVNSGLPAGTASPITNYGPGIGGAAAVMNGGSMRTQVITSGRSGGMQSFGSRASTFIRSR